MDHRNNGDGFVGQSPPHVSMATCVEKSNGYVLVIGSPIDGYYYFGPYKSENEARAEAAENADWVGNSAHAWITKLRCARHAGPYEAKVFVSVDSDIQKYCGYVLVVGSPIEGYHYYGPFNSEEEAHEDWGGRAHVSKLICTDEAYKADVSEERRAKKRKANHAEFDAVMKKVFGK